MNYAGAHTLSLASLQEGTLITVINDTGSNMTLDKAGVALLWMDGATRQASANRTLAYGGVATLYQPFGGNWFVWGMGIT